MRVTNTLAYYDTELITAVKKVLWNSLRDLRNHLHLPFPILRHKYIFLNRPFLVLRHKLMIIFEQTVSCFASLRKLVIIVFSNRRFHCTVLIEAYRGQL